MRSPSLDLVWPEAPQQPSTTAGQPGHLSPASDRYVLLSASDLRVSRLLAVKQAWHLCSDRSSRAVGVGESPIITAERRAKR